MRRNATRNSRAASITVQARRVCASTFYMVVMVVRAGQMTLAKNLNRTDNLFVVATAEIKPMAVSVGCRGLILTLLKTLKTLSP